ncbi:MAG: hypothetical protein ACLUFV_11800 [Acutalibacteraceae bacterium]
MQIGGRLRSGERQTAAPTMTTGRSTATCCSGTTCSAVRSRCLYGHPTDRALDAQLTEAAATTAGR